MDKTDPMPTIGNYPCEFTWKQWPNKKCQKPAVSDEHGRMEYCGEHQRIMYNREFRSGAKKSKSPAQKAYYKRFWAQQRSR